MFKSIFSDELGLDFTKAIPYFKEWGLRHCDFRGRIFQKPIEDLTATQLREVRRILDDNGFKTGCIQSSLAKAHLPAAERMEVEKRKLEGIIRASEILECNLVRSFFFWQPPVEELGDMAIRPDVFQKVMDAFLPFAEKAKAAGLRLAFENCGCTSAECFALLDALDIEGWGFAWDPKNHWLRDKAERERDLEAYLLRHAKRAICLHVKSIGTIPEFSEELIPYKRIFEICEALGLKGPVSVETHNQDKTQSDIEISHRVLKAVDAAWPAAASGAQQESVSISASNAVRAWAGDPLRFAVVGLGMGHNRAIEISKTPGVKLVSVCDLVDERARRTAEACGVPGVSDFQKQLDDPSVEAVFILNETGRHHELACRALEAGKHVLLTKPMDITLSACDKMIALAKRKNRVLAVDFCRRVRPSVLSLKRTVESGWMGRLLSGSVSLRLFRDMDYFKANGGWRGTKALDGGVLCNQNIHHTDEMVFCLGVPEKVRCDVWRQSHDIEMEDLGCAVWQYASGLVLTIYATTSFPQSTWYYQYELHGAEGVCIHREGGPLSAPEDRCYKTEWKTGFPERVESPWLNSMDNFAAALRTGAPLLCSAEDARRTQSVLVAMYESAYERQGAWTDVRN